MVFTTDQRRTWRTSRILTQDSFVSSLYPSHRSFSGNMACQAGVSDYFLHICESDRVQSSDEYVLLSPMDMFTCQSKS